MNQLELSPFNTHDDIVTWCSQNGISIGCATWSKLSSTQAIQDAWLDVVGDIAKTKSCTKAQVLIRWSMQKGYICVPRSAAATKIERIAIAENTYGGVSGFLLSQGEMNALDNLNVSLKAGTLGRRDGWEDSDVSGEDWDPTDYA
jgi:diketogulonate reductase-like aldo/keto reductase